MPEPDEAVSYRRLLRFFLPLGLTPFMIASTHSIVNAALARLPSPEANLAVFAVVQALANAIKAPCLLARQTTLALVNRHSYRLIMRFVWAVCAFFTAALLVLGFTPAGGWVLRNVIGLTDPSHITLAYTALRFVALLPIVETLRNGYQGIAIGLESTAIMPIGTTVRLAGLCLFLWWAVSAQSIPGVVVGTLTWIVGIGVEGLFVVGYLMHRFGTLERSARHMPRRNGGSVSLGELFKFFIPLALMMSLAAWMHPVIQSGLARGDSAVRSLAAYGVALGLTVVVGGPISMLHQTAMVYAGGLDDPNWRRVKRFCLAVGGAISVITLVITLSPLGQWIMGTVMGVPAGVGTTAIQTWIAFAPHPLISSWREAYWGILMRQRRTSLIGLAKTANFAAVFGAVLALFGPLQTMLPFEPAVMGALAFVTGEAVESVVVWYHATRRHGHAPGPTAGTPSSATA